jgi:thiol:disulfide interchange protein
MFAVGLSDIPPVFCYSDEANSRFLGDMLAALVAAPCVTSFMTLAIGFALTQSSVFVFIGIFFFLC